MIGERTKGELHMKREGNTGTEGLTSEWEGYDREKAVS